MGEDGSGLIGDAAGLDDDPGEGVRDEQEGVEEAGEVEGLEGPDVGGRDDDEGAPGLDTVLKPLLALNPLDDVVGPYYLAGVGMGPGADADTVPADHHPAPGAVGDGEGRRRGRRRDGGEGEGEGLGAGGCGGGRSGGRRGSENGGGGVEGSGGEKEEEDKAGEAEAEDEADEAAEAVEEEPKAVGRGPARAVGGAAVGQRRGRPVCGDSTVVVVLRQPRLHFRLSLSPLSSSHRQLLGRWRRRKRAVACWVCDVSFIFI